ncbi:MAG: DUF2065 domain-containing protein [Candidatus Nitrotoga sp.]
MLTYWLLGFALMLIIEGFMPFIFPAVWRNTLLKLAQLTDGQVRFIGMLAMLAGLLLLVGVPQGDNVK